MSTEPQSFFGSVAASHGLQSKSDTIWNFIQANVSHEMVVLRAMLWAKLLQNDITILRGEQSPHEVVFELAEERLQLATNKSLSDEEVALAVDVLHKSWLYGDALLSWYKRYTGKTPAQAPVVPAAELPRRARKH